MAPKHVQKPPVPEEGEEEAPEVELNPVGYVPNLMEDNAIWQWAGIGFGEHETYKLLMSIKKLANTTQATNLSFWGKIFGTQKDYYIVEGVAEGEDEGEGEEEKPPEFEAKGSGINRFTYWVTDNVFENWSKLPDMLPSDVEVARKVKVSFTGNLKE